MRQPFQGTYKKMDLLNLFCSCIFQVPMLRPEVAMVSSPPGLRKSIGPSSLWTSRTKTLNGIMSKVAKKKVRHIKISS